MLLLHVLLNLYGNDNRSQRDKMTCDTVFHSSKVNLYRITPVSKMSSRYKGLERRNRASWDLCGPSRISSVNIQSQEEVLPGEGGICPQATLMGPSFLPGPQAWACPCSTLGIRGERGWLHLWCPQGTSRVSHPCLRCIRNVTLPETLRAHALVQGGWGEASLPFEMGKKIMILGVFPRIQNL